MAAVEPLWGPSGPPSPPGQERGRAAGTSRRAGPGWAGAGPEEEEEEEEGAALGSARLGAAIPGPRIAACAEPPLQPAG